MNNDEFANNKTFEVIVRQSASILFVKEYISLNTEVHLGFLFVIIVISNQLWNDVIPHFHSDCTLVRTTKGGWIWTLVIFDINNLIWGHPKCDEDLLLYLWIDMKWKVSHSSPTCKNNKLPEPKPLIWAAVSVIISVTNAIYLRMTLISINRTNQMQCQQQKPALPPPKNCVGWSFGGRWRQKGFWWYGE